MSPARIKIIQPIHGKRTADGKISEPDIYWILDKWLERHPEVKQRQQDKIHCPAVNVRIGPMHPGGPHVCNLQR